MNFIWLTIAILTRTHGNIADDAMHVSINRYCRDRNRLVTFEENDEYLLVSAESNVTIMLACRYCDERNNKLQSKIWYQQDRYQDRAEVEVELGMDNNVSNSKIYTTSDLSLVIRSFSIAEAGVYRCHGAGQEKEDKYNYRVELFKDATEYMEEGNITEWERYRETYLWPVTMRFAISKMTDLAEIREEGVTLRVISEWGSWSPCKQCVDNRGVKTIKGYCRLKRSISSIVIERNDSTIIRFFRGFSTLPCKSILLHNEFPSISRIVRYLPEFNLKELCKKCLPAKKIKKAEKFRYIKRYVLTEGAHLAIICPDSTEQSQVIWRKDSLVLKKGTDQLFYKIDEEARLMVDTFSALYLKDVSAKEQGNYTCYVDNVNMMRVKIIVVSKVRLLTQGFFRHLGYLGFIFFLTSFCYCTGVIMTYRRRDKFRPLQQDDSMEENGS